MLDKTKRWHHRIEQLEGNRNVDGHLLAKCGEDGWELVSVLAITPSNIKAFLKKPVEDLEMFENKTIAIRTSEQSAVNGNANGKGGPPIALRNERPIIRRAQ